MAGMLGVEWQYPNKQLEMFFIKPLTEGSLFGLITFPCYDSVAQDQ
jgi:hypothetical protein